MKTIILRWIVPFIVVFFNSHIAFAQVHSDQNFTLKAEFTLAEKHLNATQYYLMETHVTALAFNGTRTPQSTYRLALKCVPGKLPGGAGDNYTCARFTVQTRNKQPISLAALTDWTYVFKGAESDEKGQVLGIDHAKFEAITDSAGKVLPADISYMVYNTFIDFHAFCNVFAEKTSSGNGIQDLKKIGQKIIHSSAFSEPPVNLGTRVSEGSVFRNGEITLEFKGIGIQNGTLCAIIGYDSGESSFKMIMLPMPDMKTETNGSSHYWGDIYKSLATGWVQKVSMTEVVFSETAVPLLPTKVNSITERSLHIRNVSQQEFESALK